MNFNTFPILADGLYRFFPTKSPLISKKYKILVYDAVLVLLNMPGNQYAQKIRNYVYILDPELTPTTTFIDLFNLQTVNEFNILTIFIYSLAVSAGPKLSLSVSLKIYGHG